MPQSVIDQIHATKAAGKRVIAVGTTSVRSLESSWSAEEPYSGCAARFFDIPEQGDVVARENATTSLFLMPGSQFHVVDAMVTNFHVPRSTLMRLVSAFASRERIMEAYGHAIESRYRMLSFGDAMLII